MSEKASGKKGLSEREAALIAAARRELGKAPAASAGVTPREAARDRMPAPPIAPHKPAAAGTLAALPAATTPPVAAPTRPIAAPAPQAATPADFHGRMALLIEAERIAHAAKKRRARRNTMIGIAAVMVPALLYVIVNLFKLLVN